MMRGRNRPAPVLTTPVPRASGPGHTQRAHTTAPNSPPTAHRPAARPPMPALHEANRPAATAGRLQPGQAPGHHPRHPHRRHPPGRPRHAQRPPRRPQQAASISPRTPRSCCPFDRGHWVVPPGHYSESGPPARRAAGVSAKYYRAGAERSGGFRGTTPRASTAQVGVRPRSSPPGLAGRLTRLWAAMTR